MGRVKRWLLAGMLAVSCLPGVARAESEMEILLNKLVEKGILTTVEATDIRREVRETKEEHNQQLAKEIVPDSARNWTWKGDVRLRNEYRNRTGSGQDVNRQRIRFRYGFEAKISDELKAGARLATGTTSDPVSTNQSFNTVFNHKSFVLDRAFLEYGPELPGVTKATLTGGIIENPFWGVGAMIWDDDLNFDGAAARLEKAFGPVTVFTNDGVFSMETDITESVSLWSTQGGVIIRPFRNSEEELMKNLKLTGALAYHDYKNLTRGLSKQAQSGITNAVTTAGGFKGNSNSGGLFTVDDFNLLNPTIELATQYAAVPFSAFGDWVHNTAASHSGNGFQIGLKIGKATAPLDLKKGWEAGYFFERLEPDATFGAFADGDFGGGGTDHRGHGWYVKLAALKGSEVKLTYLNTQELKGTKNHFDTLQADWVTKF